MEAKELRRYLILITNISGYIKKEEMFFYTEEMDFLFFMGFDVCSYHSI